MKIEEYIKGGKIRVKIKPNASRNEIINWDEERKILEITISAAPEKGKANKELIKFLSGLTGKRVRIKTGLGSRIKTIIFEGIVKPSS